MTRILTFAALLLHWPALAQTLNQHIIDGAFSIQLPAATLPEWKSPSYPGSDFLEIKSDGLRITLRKHEVPNTVDIDSIYVRGYMKGMHYWIENTSLKMEEKSFKKQGIPFREVRYTTDKKHRVAEACFILKSRLYFIQAIAEDKTELADVSIEVIQSIQPIQKN